MICHALSLSKGLLSPALSSLREEREKGTPRRGRIIFGNSSAAPSYYGRATVRYHRWLFPGAAVSMKSNRLRTVVFV